MDLIGEDTTNTYKITSKELCKKLNIPDDTHIEFISPTLDSERFVVPQGFTIRTKKSYMKERVRNRY